MVATVIGLTRPNVRHFCPFCEIMLANLSKRVPHSLVLFENYISSDQVTPKLFDSRTLEAISQMPTEYQQAGGKTDTAKQYKNGENMPLIPEKAPLINEVSVMPVHLSLGIWLQFINILEDAAVSLDIEIWEASGLTSDGVIESYNKQDQLEVEIQSASVELGDFKKNINFLQTQKRTLKLTIQSILLRRMGKLKTTALVPKQRGHKHI